MAYRASTYRPGTEDTPNVVSHRRSRERSPRRIERRTTGSDTSPGQTSKVLKQSENSSRSQERSASMSNNREWEMFRDAIHTRIEQFADEIIRDGWQAGFKVTNQNYQRFATEVLIYVRSRFYTATAKNETQAHSLGYDPGRDPRNGPYPPKLMLEDMQWVWDKKIKPVIDKYSKEPFLCNGCESTDKIYNLHGLLTHYASEHTSTLSKGTLLVDMTAEWPEHPPFRVELDIALNTSHLAAASAITASASLWNASPPGLNGYNDNIEIEKKRREMQIREREIRIKEAKEEIEMKERERAERERELRERQACDIVTSEKQGKEVEIQAPIFEKPLDDGKVRGHDVSNVEQTDSIILQDIHKQVGRKATTGSSEQIHLPRFQDSDPETRGQGPMTISVEMSNMDSDHSNSRANQRLHLTGLFTQFMSEVSQQTALQIRRDSAKKILEQKTAAHGKALTVQREFPSTEESTRASRERARKEFDKIEEELFQRREASMKLSEKISEVVYPVEEPSENDRNTVDKIDDLQNKLAQYQVNSEALENKQQQLDQLYSTVLSANDKHVFIESIEQSFGSIRQELAPYAAKSSFLEAEIAQLKQNQEQAHLKSSVEGLGLRMTTLEQQSTGKDITEIKSKIEALSYKLDEVQHTRTTKDEAEKASMDNDADSLRSTMGTLSTKIEALEASNSELGTAVETINSNLALQSAAINDRSEMQSVHSSIKALSRTESETRTGFAKLQSQMQGLEKDLRVTKMTERGRQSLDASSRDPNSLSNDLRQANDLRRAIADEISLQQEAVDTALSEKLRIIEGQLESLKEHVKPLEAKIGEVQVSLGSFRSQYTTQTDRVAIDLGNFRGEINTTKEDVNYLRHNDIQSLQMAYNNLDFRMNNLSTELLARQILGQLDAHIRGSEKNIMALELRLQEVERRAVTGVTSTVSRREIEERIKKAAIELTDGLNEGLDKVKSTFVELNSDLVKEQMQLRADIDRNRSHLENVKADVEGSKSTITEAMGSLRTEMSMLNSKAESIEKDLSASKIIFTGATRSLEAEVDNIGLSFQTVQDDLGATKNKCTEATSSLKAEISKVAKSFVPEKRSMESSTPVKTNGYKRKKPRQSISDSDDDV